MPQKRWVLAPQIDLGEREKHPDLDPVVLQLLYNRGVTGPDEIKAFLKPVYERDIHAPELFSNMSEATTRVFDALERGETITVHGDYDADGVCGTTAVVSTLREIMSKTNDQKSKIEAYLPDRERDGYGVAVHTVERLAEEGTKLLITVDCGISNLESIARAKELGIDTIICDHHTVSEQLPDAILVHPLVPSENYPNKHLCGTGVAAKFAWGLINEARRRGTEFPDGYEKWLLDLVAIATVTDVMPITGENRALEKYGLLVLNKTRRVGLKKLVDVAGLKLGSLDTWNIGFQIGPRINAAGRMKDATVAFNLLAEGDELQAALLAVQLDEINRARQKASDALYREAKEKIHSKDAALLVSSGEGWAHGLVGLVAGKLLSEFGRPVFVVTKNGDTFVGSGRAPGGFDITAAMRAGEEFYDKCGGHKEACGFTIIGEENFNRAMAVALGVAAEHFSGEVVLPTLEVDAEIRIDDIDWPLVESLQALEPYGKGNARPLFVSRGTQVQTMMPVGKDKKHVRLAISDKGGNQRLNVIAFRRADLLEELAIGSIIDVVYELGINEWNGNRSIQLRLVDIKAQITK